MQDFIVEVFGYEKLKGSPRRPFADLVAEISNYELSSILETSSKIMMQLNSNDGMSIETQIQLVKDIFSDDYSIRESILLHIRQKTLDRWAVFTPQSILIIIKLALLHCRNVDGKKITPDEVINYGLWVLEMTDLITGTEEENSKMGKEEIRSHFARQHFFNHTDNISYMMARFSRILEFLKVDGRIDVLKYFTDATGLNNPSEYLQFCFYLLIKYINLSTRKVDITTEWVQCTSKYFEQTKLTSDEIDRCIKFLLIDNVQFIKLYTESVRSLMSGNDYIAYNFVVFEKRPLLRIDENCFICSHPKYLANKLYNGFYWTIENYLLDNKIITIRKLLPNMWGEAFDRYISECLQNGFKSHYFRPGIINKIERTDGILETKHAIYFLQIKAIHIKLEAKYRGNNEDFNSILSGLLSLEKGYGQIIKNIKDLRRRKWYLTFDRKNRPIIPVLVVDEMIPMDPLNRQFYEEYTINNKTQYIKKDIYPFIILCAEEVEILEAIAISDYEKAEKFLFEYAKMFSTKANNKFLDSMSFKSFLNTKKNEYEIPKNSRLFKISESFARESERRAFFKNL